jgi:hypothetical protein
MTSQLPKTAVAETLAQKIVALKPGTLPAVTARKCEDLLIDVVGLCVTARNAWPPNSPRRICWRPASCMAGSGSARSPKTQSAIRRCSRWPQKKFAIEPQNPYPDDFTGHIRATQKVGSVIEERQPYLHGSAQELLTRQDVTEKVALNARHGGWTKTQSDATLKTLATLYGSRIDLSSLRG